MSYQLHVGRCEEVLKSLPDNSVDSIVTDPPYGLEKGPQEQNGAVANPDQIVSARIEYK